MHLLETLKTNSREFFAILAQNQGKKTIPVKHVVADNSGDTSQEIYNIFLLASD
jgi:hypothetical protein